MTKIASATMLFYLNDSPPLRGQLSVRRRSWSIQVDNWDWRGAIGEEVRVRIELPGRPARAGTAQVVSRVEQGGQFTETGPVNPVASFTNLEGVTELTEVTDSVG